MNSFKNENYIFFLNEINTVESLYLYNDFDDVNMDDYIAAEIDYNENYTKKQSIESA